MSLTPELQLPHEVVIVVTSVRGLHVWEHCVVPSLLSNVVGIYTQHSAMCERPGVNRHMVNTLPCVCACVIKHLQWATFRQGHSYQCISETEYIQRARICKAAVQWIRGGALSFIVQWSGRVWIVECSLIHEWEVVCIAGWDCMQYLVLPTRMHGSLVIDTHEVIA